MARFITTRIVPGAISLEQIRKNVTDLNAVKIGLPDSPHAEGLTLSQLGLIHEYGTATIPSRPFLYSGISEGREEINRLNKTTLAAVQTGELSKQEALGRLGNLGVRLVQEKIRGGPFVPLNPATISAKGSSAPLIDTGQLRASVTFEVEG